MLFVMTFHIFHRPSAIDCVLLEWYRNNRSFPFGEHMTNQMKVVVMTMNVTGLTHKEFRAILDGMGVETRPEPGIYQHISHPTETGFRIIEIWESQKGFEEFAE